MTGNPYTYPADMHGREVKLGDKILPGPEFRKEYPGYGLVTKISPYSNGNVGWNIHATHDNGVRACWAESWSHIEKIIDTNPEWE